MHWYILQLFLLFNRALINMLSLRPWGLIFRVHLIPHCGLGFFLVYIRRTLAKKLIFCIRFSAKYRALAGPKPGQGTTRVGSCKTLVSLAITFDIW